MGSLRHHLETFVQDVRHALRLMRRDPAFTGTALFTLALGIGLNSAIFSVAYGVLWRPLPYPEADRLVMVSSTQMTGKGLKTFQTWAPTSYDALRRRLTTFDRLVAYNSIEVQLTGRGEPQQVPALEVSPDFLATLGVTAARGRAFLIGAGAPEDDRSAVVSDRLWRSLLNGDPAVVGQTLVVDGVPRTIVGVLPRGFSFRPVVSFGALPDADVYLPNRWPGDPGGRAFLFLLGRTRPGVTRARAEAELTPLLNDPAVMPAGAISAAGTFAPNVRTLARTVGLQEHATASVRKVLLVLLGAVSFVLLIACLNVANLQLARLTARRGELALRMALGAGRGRIVRQLLTEAVVLSLLGALLGVILARVALDVTLPLVPPASLPGLGGVAVDARVLAFCLGLSVVSTLVIGLVPLLRFGGSAAGESLSLHAGDTRTTGDRQGERLRMLLVAAQIAMTLVLLIGAGLLMHSFVRLTSVSPGFHAGGRDGVVQTVRVRLPTHLYDEPARIRAFTREVLDRARFLPGVRSSSVINSVPFGLMFIQTDFSIEGQPKPTLFAGIPLVEAEYFRTMGIPLLAGREFTPRDTTTAPRVAIISERIVRDYFPGGPGDALGRRVRVSDRDEWATVVGVVADIRQRGLDQPPTPMIYTPFAQSRDAFLLRFVTVVARTDTPAGTAEGIRAEIRRVAPDVPVVSTVTMAEAVANSVATPRVRTVLLMLFAATATLIAAGGLFGLVAYAVTQRRREIGVRMALGAQHRDVLRLVLVRAFRIVAAGLVIGLAGAAALARVLRGFLFGVTPTDPIVFALVSVLLMAVALVAAWLPARRATQIDSCDALRAE